MAVREPAVAGRFYPADTAQLKREVEVLLRFAVGRPSHIPKALIVPHARLVYSGNTAAKAFRLLVPACHIIHRVVLLGPVHDSSLKGLAIPTADAFRTPLGAVTVNTSAIETLSRLPDVTFSDDAHLVEHSIEVQLPFLQTILDDFQLVPIIVGDCPPSSVAKAIDSVWGGPETLIVISSDLSQDLPYDEAKVADAATTDRILHKSCDLTHEEACGAVAINGLMQSQNAQPLKIKAIEVRNSGDSVGHKDHVVGYGAFLLY